MICPSCKVRIDNRSNFCNRCGAKQEQDRFDVRDYRSGQQYPSGNDDFDFSILNDKKYLLISLVCFAWATFGGLPAVVRLLTAVLGGSDGSIWVSDLLMPEYFPPMFSAALHFVVPLMVGYVLFRKHKDEESRR